MPATIYRDDDADFSLLDGKTIAILGYGSQGRAHALNLRDSGCRVIVAELPDTANHQRAVEDGFQPLSAAEAAGQGDVVALLLPDELQGEVFDREIRRRLSPGKVLVCAHGFNVHFGLIDAPEGVATVLVAPTGPGPLLRSEFVRGSGIPGLVAVGPRTSPEAMEIALAYSKGIGCTRVGVIETTFAEETVTDLFGEQAVLCGGLGALAQAGFETLVEAGYQPEIAYFECVHQLKLIVDLIYQGGLSYMRKAASNTAEFGDYTRGPRLVTAETKAEMKRILEEICDGRFAREWMGEHEAGGAAFRQMRRQHDTHPVEEIGRRLRNLGS
jgi:ketol-acid reductoisomerase